MITLSWALLWIVLSLLCFAAVAVGRGALGRINLIGAGLAFLVLYLIFSGDLVHVHIGG